MADVDPIWCVIANVADVTRLGTGGSTARSGTRHFSGETKVYCFPPLWGDGYEDIKVLGKHRGARGLSEMVIPRRHLENWRAKLIYDPHAISVLRAHWDGSTESRKRAEDLALQCLVRSTCPDCRIDDRTLDLSEWWVCRTGPILAYCNSETRTPFRIEVISRMHFNEGIHPEFADFDSVLKEAASVVRSALGKRPKLSPMRLEGGHVRATLVPDPWSRACVEHVANRPIRATGMDPEVTLARFVLGQALPPYEAS